MDLMLRRRTVRWLVGVLLAFFAGGLLLWLRASWQEPDKRAIEARYNLWYSALRDQRPAEAYAVMSPAYRASHTLEEFKKQFGEEPDWLHLNPKNRPRIHGTKACLIPARNGWQDVGGGPDFAWTKVDGNWFLTGEFDYYVD